MPHGREELKYFSTQKYWMVTNSDFNIKVYEIFMESDITERHIILSPQITSN